jgi:hypothetical protein
MTPWTHISEEGYFEREQAYLKETIHNRILGRDRAETTLGPPMRAEVVVQVLLPCHPCKERAPSSETVRP